MTSAKRKLARGIEHVETLRRETMAFQNAGAYMLRTEREDRSSDEVEYRCFAVEHEAPPDHWPLLAGEAVQNLRSALDHAIYAASGKRTRRRSQFPIFTDACEFQVKGRPMIAGLPANKLALVEQRQPYIATAKDPDWDPLATLGRLSNLDKHRSLTTVAAAIGVQLFSYSAPGAKPQMWFTDRGDGRTLHEGTPVMAFVIQHPNATQVNVDPDFGYEVRIEGRPLADTLVFVARRVFECVYEVENGHAVPDLTPYDFYPI